MSALKRFVAGFATSLAEQNNADKNRQRALEDQQKLDESRARLAQRTKERETIVEEGDDVFAVVTSGEGIELFRRKYTPTEVAEYKSKATRARASEVKDNYDIENYVKDKEEERRMNRESHSSSLESARVNRDTQRTYASRVGAGGLDSMTTGGVIDGPEGEAIAAAQLVSAMNQDVRAAITAARKRGESITMNDINKAARAAVAASGDAMEAEDRFSMVLRQILGTQEEGL